MASVIVDFVSATITGALARATTLGTAPTVSAHMKLQLLQPLSMVSITRIVNVLEMECAIAYVVSANVSMGLKEVPANGQLVPTTAPATEDADIYQRCLQAQIATNLTGALELRLPFSTRRMILLVRGGVTAILNILASTVHCGCAHFLMTPWTKREKSNLIFCITLKELR